MADPSYADAISGIESGGEANPYAATGPKTRTGDQAYGKFQIMGANIPQWSKEILGQELTPQQFLANPKAQEAIFAGKFGQYVDKYGPEGAAQAWIGGPGGVGKLDRKDSLGTSIGDYGKRFMAGLGQPSAPTSPNPGVNPPPPQRNPLPAYNWSPATSTPGQAPNAPSGLPMGSQGPSDAGGSPFVPGQTQPMAPLPAMPGMLPAPMPQLRGPQLAHLQALLANAPPSIRGLISRG